MSWLGSHRPAARIVCTIAERAIARAHPRLRPGQPRRTRFETGRCAAGRRGPSADAMGFERRVLGAIKPVSRVDLMAMPVLHERALHHDRRVSPIGALWLLLFARFCPATRIAAQQSDIEPIQALTNKRSRARGCTAVLTGGAAAVDCTQGSGPSSPPDLPPQSVKQVVAMKSPATSSAREVTAQDHDEAVVPACCCQTNGRRGDHHEVRRARCLAGPGFLGSAGALAPPGAPRGFR